MTPLVRASRNLWLVLAIGGCASTSDSFQAASPGDDAWVAAHTDGSAGATANASADTTNTIKYFDTNEAAIGAMSGGPTKSGDGEDKSTLGLAPGGPQNVAAFRALIEAGQVPTPDTFTMAGWLAEHGTALPPAVAERPIDLHALAAVLSDTKAGPPEVVVQLGFNSVKSLQDLQPALAIAVIVDTSGSMAGGPLESARAGVLHLIDHLPKGSWLTLVTFDDTAKVSWPGAIYTADQREGIKQALTGWKATGATDLHGGLDTGVSAVLAASGTFGARHVVLLSDGAATKGDVAPASLKALGAKAAAAKATISTIAYGWQAQATLLKALALTTGGTHHSAVTPSALEALFVKDLGLFLAPVASNLGVVLKLAPGWALDQVYGFDLVPTAAGIALQPIASANGGTADAASGGPDAQARAPDALATPGQPAVMSTLFASGHSAIVLARLLPPANVGMAAMLDLNLANVTYKYTLTADGQNYEHVVPVQLAGKLFQVPDEGTYAYYASPIVRRAFVLHRLGRAMAQATVLHLAGKSLEGRSILTSVMAFAGLELDKLDLAVDDPDGRVASARLLAKKLHDNLPAK